MLKKERISYTYEDVEMEGILVFEKETPAPGPGVLVLHEYTGIDDHIVRQAEILARNGYRAFIADIYGKTSHPETVSQARKLYRLFQKDRHLLQDRASAGLHTLAELPQVDAGKLICIGFSLGGCAALELARSGADLQATVSVYGYLDTPRKAVSHRIRSKLLVLHGTRDTVVPMDDLFDFIEEMSDAEADCQVNVFTTATHGFCNSRYRDQESGNNAYCPVTERRMWQEVLYFFREALHLEEDSSLRRPYRYS